MVNMPETEWIEWIEWAGGDCPVFKGQQFFRRHRQGDVLGPMKAWHGNMRRVVWAHKGDGRDIIAYRVVPHEA